MRKKILSLIMIGIVSTGVITGCGSTKKDEEKVNGKVNSEEKNEDYYKGFAEYVDSDLTIKYPEELKEEKDKKDVIKYSGIIDKLEEKKTTAELEKEKLDARKGETEEVKREKKPLTLEIKKEQSKLELKEYYDGIHLSKNVKPMERIYSLKEKDYYVISWKNDGLIYYEKGILKDGTIFKFTYSFAEDKKENYNEIIEKTYKSFKLK